MSYTSFGYRQGELALLVDTLEDSTHGNRVVVLGAVTSIASLERLKVLYEGGHFGSSSSRTNIHLQLWLLKNGVRYRYPHFLYDTAGNWRLDNFLALHCPISYYPFPGAWYEDGAI